MTISLKAPALAMLAALAVGAACEPHPSPASAPSPAPATSPSLGGTGLGTGGGSEEPGAASPAAPQEASADDAMIVARMGLEEVTLGDLRHFVRRRALQQGVPPEHLAPPEAWRDPYFLVTTSDAVLQERRLLAEGLRLGLLPDLEQLLEAWRAHPDLSLLLGPRLDDLEAQLRDTLGLGVDDVYHLLRLELVREGWLALVIARLDDERIWDEYRYRRRTATVEAVAIPNVPSRDELAAFLDDPARQRELEAAYAEHPRRFTLPESVDVRLVRVRVAPDAPPEAWEAARERAEALRGEALAGGDMVAMSVERSDDTAAERGGVLEGVVRRQLPDVFDQEPHAVGPLQRDDWGWYFARVEARHPQRQRPLDELLRRELAAQRLAHERILATAARRAQRVFEAMRTGDEAVLSRVLDEEGLRPQVVGPVRFEPDGHVAGVGTSPAMRDALFALREPGEVAPEPFLVGGVVWMVRLVERHEPTPDELAAERDAFVAELHDLVRATAWDAFWAEQLAVTPLSLEAPEDYLSPKDDADDGGTEE